MAENFQHKSYREQVELLESRGIVFSGRKAKSKS
ncbi:hypothetical protein BQ8897_BM110_00202 [Streptococcus agalactiae]|nr:hypothetical protein BQ8897_BM110_00202 [Streptococcus agalactiae]SUN26105.1 Uncharacterised protein [Streptococcus agalactiae]